MTLMTGEDLRTVRTALGLSQERLAERLDVGRRTVIRWEQGAWPIPRVVELALETLKREVTP